MKNTQKHNTLIYLLLFMCLGNFTFAQSEQATSLLKEATELSALGKFALANPKLQSAAKIFQDQGNWSQYAKCGAELGKNLTDANKMDEAIASLKATIEMAEKPLKGADENLALAYKYLGRVYYKQENLGLALIHLSTALKIREGLIPGNPDLARDYFNLAIICRMNGQFGKASVYLDKALTLQKKAPNQNILGNIYEELANVNKSLGNFSAAEDYIDQAISIFKGIYGEVSPKLASCTFLKGEILLKSASNNDANLKARAVLQNAVQLFEKNPIENYADYASCYNSLGYSYFVETHINANSAKKALDIFTKVSGIIEKGKLKNTLLELTNNMNLAAVHTKLNNFDQSKKYQEKCNAIAQSILPDKHPTKGTITIVEAETAIAQNDLDKALELLQNAAVSITQGYKETNPTAILDWKFIEEGKVVSLEVLQNIYAKKARVYSKKYENSKNAKDLENGLKQVEFCDKVIDKMRADFSAEGAKMTWSDFSNDAFENAIDICVSLFKATKDAKYKEQAYYFSEKAKGLSLLEAFQNSKANKMAGLPETILKEEEAYRLEISDIKQQLFQLKQKGAKDSPEAAKLETLLFEKKLAFSKFNDKLKQDYSAYYTMKHDIKLLSVEETRKILRPDQALLEYFVGDRLMFVFKITPTEFDVIPIEGAMTISKEVRSLRDNIYGYYLNSGERTEESYAEYANAYAVSAHEMYKKLIAPLGQLPKRLIIIPSGSLSNMPFEPLLVEKPKDAKQYASHHYFAKDHIIAYNYSATLLNEMRSRKHSKAQQTLLAFAPEFGEEDASEVRGKRFALSPLAFNTSEVENVRKIVGRGTIFTKKDATEDKFKALASQYQIIHFATHGMANDKDPDFSLLAFTEIADTIENEFVYVSDLYNMQLNADLVVLSACETGLGEMRKGEGVISLARGFSYAGAKSIFTTLWSVNDQATSQIVESFYRYLRSGKDKDEALHLAKMDFLAGGNNMTSHPFLWSPYIFIGDPAPIDIGYNFPWVYLMGGVGVLGVVGFLFMRRRKRKEAA